MAIDTNDEKLALQRMHLPHFPRTYMIVDGIDQANKQQLLGRYPGILYGEAEAILYRKREIPWIPVIWG